MDTDRFVEFCSTVVIVGMLALFWSTWSGVTGVQERLSWAVGAAVVVGIPFAAVVVYLLDLDETHVGPWGPEDVVFIAAVAPPLVGTVWATDTFGLEGVLYGVVLFVGVVGSILFAVVVRDATVGEWPPGSSVRERGPGREPGRGGPPGQ